MHPMPHVQVALLGEAADLTYAYEHLGSDPAALAKLAASPFVAKLKVSVGVSASAWKACGPHLVIGCTGRVKEAEREAQDQ